MPTVVGLDLGKHTFRAVELEKSKKGIIVHHSGVYDNPKINFDENNTQSQKEYSQEIKEFFKEANFSTSRVCISIEEKDVFMRVISVPVMSDKELKSSITFEAEQYIPLPLKDVNLSYQKLEIPVDQNGKLSIQLVAAKKTLVEKYVQVVKDARLTPVGIEPEALAIGRVLSSKDSSDATIILHLGYEKTLILIAYKEFVVFTRTLSFGGDTMTRSVEQGLNLDYIQAEEYKKTYGLNADQAEGKIFKILEPIFSNILGEISRAQVFFTTHHPNVNINRVILSGGTALMPGLLFYMANNLNMEVELANPFKKFLFSKELEAKADSYLQQGPLFTVPIGLALKEI